MLPLSGSQVERQEKLEVLAFNIVHGAGERLGR